MVLFIFVQFSMLGHIKLYVSDVIVGQKKVPMEKESNISLGPDYNLTSLYLTALKRARLTRSSFIAHLTSLDLSGSCEHKDTF